MMHQNTIEVIATLTSPLHVAYPGNYSEGLSRTITQSIIVDGRKMAVPFYPANGFRGSLRRVIADMICDNLASTQEPVSGELYLGLHCGASSGSPDQTAKSIEEIIRAREHVYMGLFGGGARGHESMYAVSDMVPVLDATIRTGLAPEKFRDVFVKTQQRDDGRSQSIEPYMLLDERHFVRIDDLYRVANPDKIARTVADALETVTTHQVRVGINKTERKNDDGVKEDVANIQSIQAVPAGVPMFFRIDMKSDITDGQIGAMLLALAGIIEGNNFGCMGRWGFGRIKVQHLGATTRGEMLQFDAERLYEDDRFILPAELDEYAKIARKQINATRRDDIADFFRDFSANKKADAKAAKAAKKAGA